MRNRVRRWFQRLARLNRVIRSTGCDRERHNVVMIDSTERRSPNKALKGMTLLLTRC